MSTSTEEKAAEYPWVARLRQAGYDVRNGTGTGVLSEEPECSFTPPPGFRSSGLRTVLGRIAHPVVARFRRLIHAKPHATLP